MEELIGKIWDRWVTRHVATDFPDASVKLADLQSELTLYYRALGGLPAKTLEPADARKIHVKRTGLQRIAGSHQRFHLPWQNERSVRLPPALAVFPSKQLNESLYYWLTAMAAKMTSFDRWVHDNQQTVVSLIKYYPGLKTQYEALVEATLASRPPMASLSDDLLQNELLIEKALRDPGTVAQLSLTSFNCFPVWCWFYAAPATLYSVSPAEDNPPSGTERERRFIQKKSLQQRKQAQRIEDEHETDGLLVFLPDSLMSWTEQVNLDRVQDDDGDDDLEEVVNDMDLITVSRQRKATSAKVKFNLDLPAEENDELHLGPGIRLPEWDYKQGLLRPDVCLLQAMLADDVEPVDFPMHLLKTSREVKQQFALLGLQQQRLRAQPEGQELDLDAWLDGYSQPVKDCSKQNFFLDYRHHHRDFACLLLADLSLSTEGYINNDQTVIDVIRDSLLVMAEALDALQDEFAIYGFSSVRNSHIRYQLMKNFGEPYRAEVRGRIARIKPGFYTRMGAAIRQSTHILQTQSQAQRILLLVSDGKPNDLDQYEGRYGLEDTRQAIIEARQAGITPYCVTVDPDGHDYLPYLFGRDGFAVVTDPSQLPQILPRIYLTVSSH